MLIQRGKQKEQMDADAFSGLKETYAEVLLDLGTGDGRFILRSAQQRPNRLCIGLDAQADNLLVSAVRALRKPTRGGAPNALFVIAAVESLPLELRGCADCITINFPWGSLLRTLVVPNEAVLREIAALGRREASLELLINYHVFGDRGYLARMALPVLDETWLQTRLLPAYTAAGIHIEQAEFLAGKPPNRTSWGMRLTLGSGRKTLLLRGRLFSSPIVAKGEICDDEDDSGTIHQE